jgi:chaperonin GroEL (HSP60 family)
LRSAIPYKVVGGVRFYERKEVKDFLAYLRVLVNSEDEIRHLAVALNEKEVNDLVIFASDFDNSFIPQVVLRRLKGGFRTTLIKVNLWDKGILEDVCTVTGATLIDTNKSMVIKDATIDHLAVVKKVVATADKTTLIGTTTNEELRASEITKLKNQLETATAYDKQKLLERIARLSGKVATISVGAVTEIERGRVKDKIEDAVSETKLALEGGTVKGAGLALKEVQVNNILSEAIKAPYNAIQENAGGLIIGEDIVDAFLVTKMALEIACSNASNFLTVATSSAEKNENDTKEN